MATWIWIVIAVAAALVVLAIVWAATTRRRSRSLRDRFGREYDRTLAENPGQVAAYKGGKEGLLGFFVGQVMKETKGKADPKIVNELLREKLSGGT